MRANKKMGPKRGIYMEATVRSTRHQRRGLGLSLCEGVHVAALL